MAQNSGENETMEDDDFEMGLSCTLDMFREFDTVKDMIANIPKICKEFVPAERGFENLKTILDQYQEQPHLLDPYLENLISQLLLIIRNPELPSEALCLAFQYLWLLVKVRGYKTVMKKMPHEVKDLTPVLNLLEKEELQKEFYGSYILLMWLSIIIYMPFNLTAFDTSCKVVTDTFESKLGLSVVERILLIIKKNLKTPQSSREMAAFLASRFVTRPDLRETHLPEYINFCFEVLEESDPKEPLLLFNKMGVLRALGLIFKHGKREELLPYASNVMKRFLLSKVPVSQDTPLRKLSIKLIQRLGLTFVRPKVASWRYQRGSRSLVMNVKKTSEGELVQHSSNEDPDYDEENDIPSEIEDVIDYLLLGLKDKDTVVRWSAAKGIGRVTGRLPRSLADDVVGAILEQFSTRDSDKAWHGGCLALAELARRGLLLPERLPEVLPILEKALVFDELRGQYAVGANIRDAACYMCWAFARAYHPDQLSTFVQQLATGLLIVSLFDREIPCRRAGSAAFQEHVGRQGNFPHGIEILTAVDYFAVGNRTKAYLDISVFVAKHVEYTQSLIDHLVNKKVGHWDSAIRELSAKTLHNLTSLAPVYLSQNILPQLLKNSVGPVLILRHGSLLAAGYIIHALAIKAKEEKILLTDYLEKETLEKVYEVISTLDKKLLFRGMGGQYMRQAAAVFIEKCSLAGVSMEDHREVLDQWLKLLEECILLFEENIRQLSLQAIKAMWSQYYKLDSPEMISWRDNLVDRYITGQKSDRESYSLGYTAALGHLTQGLVIGKFDVILDSLLEAMKITPLTSKWAEVRREAINAIIRLCKATNVDPNGKGDECICNVNVKKVYISLLKCLDDYTMDRRGDIGAWVREASMQALQTLTSDVLSNGLDALDEEIVGQLLPRIGQQSVERIDRTRKVAGTTFASLLHSSPKLPNIPDVEKLKEIFPYDWCSSCNWASESTTFKKFVELLDFPCYRYRVLLGITYALGGVSANLSRYAQEALQNYLNDRIENKELLRDFIEAILDLFDKHQKDDRVLLPLIKGLYNLLSSCSALDHLLEEEISLVPRLLTCLKKVCFKCSDYHKLSATVMILCELLRIETTSTATIITQLSIFLGFQYPKVRAVTATSLLTALQDYSDREIVPEEHIDEVTSILEDTPWMDSMELAREKRNQVCLLIGLPVPQAKKA